MKKILFYAVLVSSVSSINLAWATAELQLTGEASRALYTALQVEEDRTVIILDGGQARKSVPEAGVLCIHTWTNGVETGTPPFDGYTCAVKQPFTAEGSAALFKALNVPEEPTTILDGVSFDKLIPTARLTCSHVITNGVETPPAIDAFICAFANTDMKSRPVYDCVSERAGTTSYRAVFSMTETGALEAAVYRAQGDQWEVEPLFLAPRCQQVFNDPTRLDYACDGENDNGKHQVLLYKRNVVFKRKATVLYRLMSEIPQSNLVCASL